MNTNYCLRLTASCCLGYLQSEIKILLLDAAAPGTKFRLRLIRPDSPRVIASSVRTVITDSHSGLVRRWLVLIAQKNVYVFGK